MKTTVDQVLVVGGRASGQPDNVLVDERATRAGSGRDRGNLYVLVEVPRRSPSEGSRAAGGPDLAARLARVVQQVYYGHRGSVTAGLQQAVRDANRLLFDENRNSLPGERSTAGLSCAVLRGSDVFIAQAGPGAAYVAHDGEITRFPDASPWLDNISAEELDAAPLGDRSETNVALFHSPLDPGDSVLLLEAEAARVLSAAGTDWAAILQAGTSGGGPAAVDALGHACAAHKCDLSAIVISVDGGAADRAEVRPAPAARPTPRAAAWAGQLRQALGSLRSAAASAGVMAGRLWAVLLTWLRRLVPSREPPLVIRAAGRTAHVEPARPTRSRVRGEGGQVRASRAAASEPDDEAVYSTPAPRYSREATAPARAARPRPGDPIQRVLAVVAVLLPIAVLIAAVTMLVGRGQSRRAAADALWQQANDSWGRAAASADRATQLRELSAAELALGQVLDRYPDRADAKELQGKVVARLDDIAKVKRVRLIGELNAYPSDAVLKRVVVQGQHVFVLDRKGGKVYHHQLDASQKALVAGTKSTVLVSRGQQVGGTLVADLVDMVWMGVDTANVRERPALVILESGGTLLEYDPTTDELNALPVGGRDVRQNPTLIGSHTGRLYLFDMGANKIWRLAPTGDGYSGAPDDWLQAPFDLAGMLDAAVGDGIYVLYANGQIKKLVSGQPAPYDVADWDIAPRNPSALASYPPDETEWVYVADTGNGRLVRTAVDGKLSRQYRPADAALAGLFKGVTALFVDESVERAYLTVGAKLYVATLPE